MISATPIRIARNLLGSDQRKLAEMSGLSRLTLQRMETADYRIRGDVEDLRKVAAVLAIAGVFPIREGASGDAEEGGSEEAPVTRQPTNATPFGTKES